MAETHKVGEDPRIGVTCVVPQSSATTLIGPQGTHITAIKQDTNTMIRVADWSAGNGDQSEQLVEVAGVPEDVLAALARIRHCVNYQKATQFLDDWISFSHTSSSDRVEIKAKGKKSYGGQVGKGGKGKVKGKGRGRAPDDARGGGPGEGRPGGRPPSPPPPWPLHEDPQEPGSWFFVNEETGQSLWELPADASGPPPAPAPPWVLVEHPEAAGEWYYLNEDTGETTWDPPEEK